MGVERKQAAELYLVEVRTDLRGRPLSSVGVIAGAEVYTWMSEYASRLVGDAPAPGRVALDGRLEVVDAVDREVLEDVELRGESVRIA